MLNIMDSQKTDRSLESSLETDELIISERQVSQQPRRNIWKYTTIFLASITIFLLLAISNLIYNGRAFDKTQKGSFENGWITELPSSRKEIGVTGVIWTGNPSFYENGTRYMPYPGNARYTGRPSQEVDAAWNELVGERHFLITEEEAKALWPTDYHLYWNNRKGGYWVGLEMFHALHCVGSMYKYFNADHYGISMTDNEIEHRDHCIDQLRQYVMCAGDITVYRSRYFKFADVNYVDSDVTHMCRDFGKIRDWVRRRTTGDLVVAPDHERQVEDIPADKETTLADR